MNFKPSYRLRFSLLLLSTHLLPLLSWAGVRELLRMSTTYDLVLIDFISLVCAIVVALLVALILYLLILRPLKQTYRGLGEIASGQFGATIQSKTRGIFRPIIDILNSLSAKLQEVLSQAQTESQVIAAESNRLRTVLNSITDGVIALDRDRRIILYNKAAARITGHPIETAAGQPINQILPAQTAGQLVLHEWLDNCEGRDIVEQHWDALELKNAEDRDLTIDADTLYTGADPNGVRTLITFHDRTEAQELEDMKIDFVALAAHELRTPITIIKGYLEILEDELGGKLEDEHKRFMKTLTDSADQLSGTINNILHTSRIEHGNLNLKFEEVDWGKFVSEAAEPLQDKAHSQGRKLQLQIAPKLPKVAVDRSSVIEVINNLVSNAIKYNKPKGKVIITVHEKDNMVETVVEDEGVGIPPAAMKKLFTKFYRSHRTKGSHQGTGLGLYMAKAIVEAHGGTIWVRSKEGEGSTFGFLLPHADDVADRIDSGDSNKIIRGVHGWIKNHTFYRG